MSLALAFLGNRWGMMIAAALAAYFFGFYSVPRVDVKAITHNAEVGRDAYWQARLRQEERKHEEELSAAIEARDSTPVIPDTPAWADELCAKSATCRDKGGNG